MNTYALGILLKYLVRKMNTEYPVKTCDERVAIQKQIDEIIQLIIETHRQWLQMPDSNDRILREAKGES